jgi:C_GCAxxG_C_C family probable redox protein
MNLEERMDEAERRGREYFKQGLNCSECVLRTFMDMHETALPDTVLRLASGFGGGMGHTKNTCGAITGAVMALGIEKGREPFKTDDVQARISQLNTEVYPVFADMIHEIEGEYGTLICRELCAPHGDFEGRTRKKSCQQLIGYCCRMAEKYAD